MKEIRIYKRLKGILLIMLLCIGFRTLPAQTNQPDSLAGHKIILDNQHKIIPRTMPVSKAYDEFLHLRWNFIKNQVPMSPGPPPRSEYPQYYFYCAFKPHDGILEPDTWMNDVAEKIPNWFESARLYYAYTGDSSVMHIVKGMVDYDLDHGMSPPDHAWPGFPFTTTNAGDTIFRGFTSSGRLALYEIQVDHAGEMGLTYLRMYQYYGEKKYLDAAIRVADVLADHAKTGTSEQSVWPYRIITETGEVTAPYGANWTGCYTLLDELIKMQTGNVDRYKKACEYARKFLLDFPMKTGYWTDGHTDTGFKSNTYKSNMSASNMTLFLFDFPRFDPDWKQDIPALIKWTEDNFVYRCWDDEPATMYGANIVGEQDSFLVKMDYQTARYAAECARWYAISGNKSYREKAYRALNWVTYCNDENGMAIESPVSKGILSWWSDCYGEGPRMFYQAFAGIPEWAPAGEDHILYSTSVLKDVSYGKSRISYTATGSGGMDFLRISFKPSAILLDGKKLSDSGEDRSGYTLRSLGGGDFAIKINRQDNGIVVISARE